MGTKYMFLMKKLRKVLQNLLRIVSLKVYWTSNGLYTWECPKGKHLKQAGKGNWKFEYNGDFITLINSHFLFPSSLVGSME